MTRKAPASDGTTGSQQANRGRRTVDQQQGGRARLAVLHDVHVTIVKPNEPVRQRPDRRACALSCEMSFLPVRVSLACCRGGG